MAVDLDHPEAARFLARLEAAAVVLPPGRREELVAELREHLADALAGADDDLAVRQAVERLGAPEDIVAAEGVPVAGPAGTPGTPPYAVPARSPWGPLEIAAVALLTVGLFLLPVVGPVAGLVCAWVSDRWTRREKVVATVWTVLPAVVLVLAVLSLFVVRVDTTPVPVPEPVVSSVPAVPAQP